MKLKFFCSWYPIELVQIWAINYDSTLEPRNKENLKLKLLFNL